LDVEDMIWRRLEEKGWIEESWQDEDGLWPQEFCAGNYGVGRSFESVRMGAKEVSARWMKASLTFKGWLAFISQFLSLC
jgi:hypothetical protein